LSQYYYFVASLPTLRYEDRDATEPREFLSEASGHLTPSDMEALRHATIDAPEPRSEELTTSAPVREWIAFERRLRNVLARSRGQRLGQDASQYIREEVLPDSAGAMLEDAVREASGHESPLSGEQILNRLRFEFADELAVNHFFDLAAVVSHYVKLQVLARRRQFNRADGEQNFAGISEKIMNEYYQENEV
jgi:hypothetical protein